MGSLNIFDKQSSGQKKSMTYHRRRSRSNKSRFHGISDDKNYKILQIDGREMHRTSISSSSSGRSNLIHLIILGMLAIYTLSFTSVHGQQEPSSPAAGFLDFDNLPLTRFSCEGKVIGGYYADVEAGCQMFHVCTLGQKDEVQDIKFLCLNGTVFDQETRVCERVDEVDCSQAEKFYDLNLNLYVPHVTTPKAGEEPLPPAPPITTTTTTSTTTTTTQRPTVRSVYSTFASPTMDAQKHGNGNNGNGKPYSAFTYFHRTPHSVISSGYNSQLRQSYLINHQESMDPNQNQNSNQNPTGRKVPSGVKSNLYTPTPANPRPTVSHDSSSSTPRPSQYAQPSPRQQSQLQRESEELAQSQRHSKEYTRSQSHSHESDSSQERGNSKPQKQSQHYADGGGSSSSSEQEDQSQEEIRSAPPTAPIPMLPIGPYPEEDYYDESAEPDYANPSSTEAPSSGNKAAQVNSHSHIALRDRTNRESKKGPVALFPLPLKTDHRKFIVHTSTAPSNVNANLNTNISTEEPYYYEDEYPLENAEDYYDENDEGSINANEHHFSHFDVPRIPYAKPNVSRVLVTNGKPFLPRLRRQSFHQQYGIALPIRGNPWDFYFSPKNSESASFESEPIYSRDEKRRRKRRRRR